MFKKKMKNFTIILMFIMVFNIALPKFVQADTKGNFIYGNTTDNGCFYERMVQLDNGDLLCTFMRSFPPGDWSRDAKSFHFYRSSDKGQTWSMVSELNSSLNGGFPVNKQGMPGMFVLPTQLGDYPAGTILFATSDWSDSDYTINIWRSTDNGDSWQYHSSLAPRGQNDGITKGNNTWEPEFAVSSDGRLVCYYADERQIGYDQCIVREISNDGGITWGDYSIIVGEEDAPTGTPGWRPGMPRVLKLKDGSYFMAFENIHSNPAGAISFKTSADGINWGDPKDRGTLVQTSHSTAFQCPAIALVDDGSTHGRLFVKGMNDDCSASKCFTSTDNGATWSEIDAPLTAVRNESRGSGWSGTFLADGNILYEINNYYNGSYNEVRFGTGVVYDDGIIISGAHYKLTNQNSGLCLDNSGGSMSPGNPMIQWHDNKLATQMWKTDYMGDGYFKLTNRFSNLCLDNLNGNSAIGNPIIQWTDNGMDPQRWNIDYTGDGYFKLNNKSSNLSLAVEDGSLVAGANIIQNEDVVAADRRWNIERVYEVTRLRSYNLPENYLRHNNSNRVIIDSNFTTLPIEDSYFKLVPGINGNPNCVSFESINMPGYYMRHRDGEVWFDKYENSSLFKADASWIPRTGLANVSDQLMVSYEASNISNNYLRHQDGVLKLTVITSNLDRADATFKFLQQ